MQKENFHIFLKKVLLCFVFIFVLNLPAFSDVQPTFYISAEEIVNAVPNPPDVNFSRKNNKDIATMEKRHFSSVNKRKMEVFYYGKKERLLWS